MAEQALPVLGCVLGGNRTLLIGYRIAAAEASQKMALWQNSIGLTTSGKARDSMQFSRLETIR